MPLDGFEPIDPSQVPGLDPKKEQGKSQESAWVEVDGPPEQDDSWERSVERLTRSLRLAEEKDKEEVARAYRVAKKTGQDPYTVTLNLDEAERKASAPNPYYLSSEAPTLTRAIETPFFANQAADDTDNLSWLEKTARIASRSWTRGEQTVRLGRLRHQQIAQGMTPESMAAIEEVKGQRKERLEPGGFWQSAIQSAAEMLPLMWEGMKEGGAKYGPATGMAAGGTALATGPASPIAAPLATGTGYTIGSLYGAAKFVSEVESGLAYDEMLEAGVDRQTAQYLAMGVGTVNALLEVSQASDVLKTIPGARSLLRRGLQKAAVKVASKSATKKQLLKAAGKGAGYLGKETVQEILQETSNIVGTEIGKSITNQLKGTDLVSATPEEVTQRLLGTAEEAMKAFLVLGLPGAAANTVQIVRTAQNEQRTEQALERIATLAGKSKLYQRNPDLFKDFVADLRTRYGHVPRKLYLDSETVQGLYSQDPGLAEVLGVEKEDLEQKLLEQEDIRIDFETAIDLYQRSDWESIRAGLRDTPFTPEDVDQQTMQRITELFQQTDELSQPAQRFRDRLLAVTAFDRKEFKKQHGVTPETYARDQAKVVDAFARVWAEATGKTPEEYWQRRGFEVEEGLQADQGHGNLEDVRDIDVSDIEVSYAANDHVSDARTGYDRDRSSQPGRDGTLREEGTDVFTPEGGPDNTEGLRTVFRGGEVEHVTTGTFSSSVEAISSPEAAAAATLPLAQEAQESLVALVADESGSPLAIIRHTIGSKDQTSTFRDLLAGAVHNTQGAAKVWVSHNHPSGTAKLSQADMQLGRTLLDLFADTGVEFEGVLAVTPAGQAAFAEPGSLQSTPVQPTQGPAKREIPVVGRKYKEIPENAFKVDSPDAATQFVENFFNGDSGLLLVNNNMSPVGFVPMEVSELGGLRTGQKGKGASKVWQGLDKTNATGAILYSRGRASHGEIENLANFAQASNFNLVDAILEGQSLKVEGSLDGWKQVADGTFFQGSLSDSYHEEHRGAVSFLSSGQALIRLFEGQDLSTVLHEIGHVFRRDLEEMATLTDAPQQIKNDWQTVLGWVGAQDGNWTREQEERFARAWEQYFMEGTAPVPSLKQVFHRFRKWLLDIYQGARRSFDLTDEVREVFDRMLATRDELDWAAERLMLDPALEQSDMTAQEWAEYERLAADAEREAMEQATRERIANWRKLQREWRRQAQELAEQNPVVQIRRRIREGGGLSLETLSHDYDRETIRELTRKAPGTIKRGGWLQPDLVADEYGYDYDGLVMALLETPTKAELEDHYFKQLEAEYDRSWRPDEALLGEARFKLLEKEIEILNRKLERYEPPASKSLARHIRKQVRQGRYQDLETDLDTLLGVMHREGKTAKQAIRQARKEGKAEAWAKALEQKKRQRLRAIKLREERRSKQRVETIRRKLRRWLKQKNIDPEYKEQLQEFLAPFDLAQRTNKALQERQSLREFIEGHRESGEQVLDIPAHIQELAAKKHPKELTLDELEEIHDTAQHIVHLGRLKAKLIAGQKARDFERVKREMVETALSQHSVKDQPPGVPPPSARERGMWEQFIESGHGWLADLRKVEFILQSIDGTYADEVQTGPWWENIFRPIQEAEHAELEWLQDVTARMDEIFKPIRDQGKEVFRKRYTIEGWSGHPLTKEEQIMMALNWGNEGNRDALRWGYGLMDEQLYRQNPEAAKMMADRQVYAVLNQLSEVEWRFVQDVWELIDSLYPRINEAHKALTGQKLERVEPTPVDTPIGRLSGGYFPLVFDRELSYKADVYKTENEAHTLFETIYSRPKTESGHRVARTGGKMAPHLRLSVITNHIQQAVHDATHAVPVRDVYKLIKDPEIRQAIIDTQGKATYDQLMPWLQWVANPIRPQMTKWEKGVRHLRNNTTIALLGANLGTMMAQPMSITQTVDAVGTKYVARAFTSFWMKPWDVVREVNEKSVQMRNRRKTWNREMADIFNQWIPQQGGGARNVREAQELAMYTISLGDYVGAYPSWMAAYQKAKDGGRSEAEAVEYADRVVRTTQPASSPKDIAAIQRLDQGEFKKMVTMFYSFFNVFMNRMYNKHQGLFQGKVSASQLVRGYVWMVLVPPILMQVFKHRGDLDEEYWRELYWKDLLSYISGTIPLVRDAVNSLVTGFDFSLTPAEEAIDIPLRLAGEVFSEDPETATLAKYGAESVGYVVGLPTPAAVDAVMGLVDIMEGRTDDYLRPVFGKKREDWR